MGEMELLMKKGKNKPASSNSRHLFCCSILYDGQFLSLNYFSTQQDVQSEKEDGFSLFLFGNSLMFNEWKLLLYFQEI
jgi:hypothetical protein